MKASAALRKHLVDLLTNEQAHMGPRAALKDFPRKLRGKKPAGAPHSPWQLLEHMRIAQWDILRFSIDAKHVSPAWPEGYWPNNAAPPNDKAWDKSVRQFLADLKAMSKLVRDPHRNLSARIPHGTGQTLLREALLVADHNAYHLGQIVTLRKMMEKR
jgi:DinB family protein